MTSSSLEGTPKKLTLGLATGTKWLPCPCCAKPSPLHDRLERRWRHLNFWQYETELNAAVPRADCAQCGVRQVEVPWARPGRGFPLLFEAWALLLAREMPVTEAAKTLGIHDTRLWRLLSRYVAKAHANADWSQLRRVGVDEASRRKGHRYVTCFADPGSGRLLYLTEGRDAATVAAFASELTAHQALPDAVTEVAMDMSPAFQSGVDEPLPGARKVFERYQVMALAGQAVDEVRKEVACEEAPSPRGRRSGSPAVDEVRKEVACEEGPLEKGALWSLRGKKERLNPDRAEQRERLCRKYSKLGLALGWREFLADTCRYGTREAAAEPLGAVHSWGRRCRLAPIRKLCATLKRHWEGILDHYHHQTTSAVMEGLNSRLQLIRRRARGYRKWRNFRTIAYWIAGGLQPETGLPNLFPQPI